MHSEMSNAVIAPVESEAVEDLLRIEKESFSNPWSRNHFISAIKSPQMDVLAYRLDDSVAGYIVLYRIKAVMVIANLAVSGEHRMEGIGSSLLKYGIQQGRENNCNYSVLDVRKSNKAAVSLYKKSGFSIIGSNKNYYLNPGEDSLVMGRPI
jgi:[ribosomal protein S18]-alanine N-acetyltransferase